MPPAQKVSGISVNPQFNQLTIAGREVRWNARSVTDKQLAQLLATSCSMNPEPELHFQPAVDADYVVSARILIIVRNSGVTKVGFVGNEAY